MLHFFRVNDLQDFPELCKIQKLLLSICKRPVFEKCFKEWKGQGAIFGQVKHGASEELLKELRIGLHFVKWNDDIVKEFDMFLAKWNGVSADNGGQDVQDL